MIKVCETSGAQNHLLRSESSGEREISLIRSEASGASERKSFDLRSELSGARSANLVLRSEHRERGAQII